MSVLGTVNFIANYTSCKDSKKIKENIFSLFKLFYKFSSSNDKMVVVA